MQELSCKYDEGEEYSEHDDCNSKEGVVTKTGCFVFWR